MNAEKFLANFGYIANAPGGVERLREMIYNLAVVGSLSEQRPEDGNAETLIAEIKKAKQRLIEKGNYKHSSKLENLKGLFDENIPEIPSTWAWARLVDIGEISPKNEADDATLVSFVPMSAISEMHSSRIVAETRPWSAIKKGYTHLADGDVALAKITPCFENGKASAISGLTNGIGSGTTELHVVRPIQNGIDPGFIYIFLRSPYFKIVGEGHMTGTAGQRRLPTEYFATRPFPVPPRQEQKRIVAKVDELMALCDRLEAQQQERERTFPIFSRTAHALFAEAPTPENLNRIYDTIGTVSPIDFRKTILTLAISGKIVPQNTADEPAQDLYKRIRSERALYSVENRFRTSHEQTMDEFSFPLPSNWMWARMSTVFNAIADGDHLPPPKSPDGIAFLTIGNVTTGKLDFDDCRYVPREYYDNLASFRQPKKGDILYTIVGATYGRPVFVDSDREFCVQRHIAILKPACNMDVGYLLLVLQSPYIYNQASAQTTGTAQPTIPLGALRNFSFPLPPIAEQRRIVTKVDELMALVDQLKAQKQEIDQLAEAFAKACVASFTGTTQLEKPEKMKAPKTELVSLVSLGKKPKAGADAPLAALLIKQGGELSAKALWQQSGLEIDAFYHQLKTELAHGWIIPQPAEMRVLEVS